MATKVRGASYVPNRQPFLKRKNPGFIPHAPNLRSVFPFRVQIVAHLASIAIWRVENGPLALSA